jgi:hypothetical protein
MRTDITLFAIFAISLFSAMKLPAQSYLPEPLPCGTDESFDHSEAKLPEDYLPICMSLSQVKYLRVAIHFITPGTLVQRAINDCDPAATPIDYVGMGNFTKHGDGFSNSGYNGFQRAEDVIHEANWQLESNAHQWRKANDPAVQDPPLNITYPADPPVVPMRYLLAGVYFHRDAAAYSLSKSRAQIYQEYGVDKDNTINVFYVPAQGANWGGAANTQLGGSVKYIFLNDYYTYVRPACREWSLTFSAQNLNHEVGHTLSLRHTWADEDFCDDTPLGFLYDRLMPNGTCLLNQRANCWRYDPSIPTCPNSAGGKPCDAWPKISNNVMDYNQYAPHAFTVCQTERLNADLAGAGNLFVHSCNGCMPAIAFFDMLDEYRICPLGGIHPGGQKVVLNGQAAFNEDTYLIDICEVDPAQPDVCIANNLNTGWLFGELGAIDLRSFYDFEPGKHYRVKLIVNNSACPPSSEYVKVIAAKPCTEEPDGPAVELAGLNPFQSELAVFYKVFREGQLTLRLVNVYTGQITVLSPAAAALPGEYQLLWPSQSLPSGPYSLQAVFDSDIYAATIIKP